MDWISTKDALPEEDKPVLIFDGGFDIAVLRKGISMQERIKMKNGELEDKIEYGYRPNDGFFPVKRSESIKPQDEYWNNLMPYCWEMINVNATKFGQNVHYWMPLHEPPAID